MDFLLRKERSDKDAGVGRQGIDVLCPLEGFDFHRWPLEGGEMAAVDFLAEGDGVVGGWVAAYVHYLDGAEGVFFDLGFCVEEFGELCVACS